jgi:carboxymethylenebutenolidase
MKKTLLLPFLLAVFAPAVFAPVLLAAAPRSQSSPPARTVHFMSEDHKTKLVGYLFTPAGAGPHAAIVLLHGRAGAYSSLANGAYTAETLSKRHKEWGEFWAARGYAALLVDSFGPRGYWAGFPKGSYKDRPEAVSEQLVRPLDAYGALKFLSHQPDIKKDRIGVQGWSNGGMTVLATMSDQSPGLPRAGEIRFRAALAEYPGCGMDAIKGDYRAYAPMLMLIAGSDEEVSPERCQEFAKKARADGNDLKFFTYPGAWHNFDDPSKTKQDVPANHKATEDAHRRVESFFSEQLLK